jgi:hypothetical protein
VHVLHKAINQKRRSHFKKSLGSLSRAGLVNYLHAHRTIHLQGKSKAEKQEYRAHAHMHTAKTRAQLLALARTVKKTHHPNTSKMARERSIQYMFDTGRHLKWKWPLSGAKIKALNKRCKRAVDRGEKPGHIISLKSGRKRHAHHVAKRAKRAPNAFMMRVIKAKRSGEKTFSYTNKAGVENTYERVSRPGKNGEMLVAFKRVAEEQ